VPNCTHESNIGPKIVKSHSGAVWWLGAGRWRCVALDLNVGGDLFVLKGRSASTNAADRAVDLRKFVGKLPDKTFWSNVDVVFKGTLMGEGSEGNMALDSFENELDEYIFTPCQYDANTDTVTITWKSVSKGVEGDIGTLPEYRCGIT
jgi:hypothetical protein